MEKFRSRINPQITINFLRTHARETASSVCLQKLLSRLNYRALCWGAGEACFAFSRRENLSHICSRTHSCLNNPLGTMSADGSETRIYKLIASKKARVTSRLTDIKSDSNRWVVHNGEDSPPSFIQRSIKFPLHKPNWSLAATNYLIYYLALHRSFTDKRRGVVSGRKLPSCRANRRETADRINKLIEFLSVRATLVLLLTRIFNFLELIWVSWTLQFGIF